MLVTFAPDCLKQFENLENFMLRFRVNPAWRFKKRKIIVQSCITCNLLLNISGLAKCEGLHNNAGVRKSALLFSKSIVGWRSKIKCCREKEYPFLLKATDFMRNMGGERQNGHKATLLENFWSNDSTRNSGAISSPCAQERITWSAQYKTNEVGDGGWRI